MIFSNGKRAALSEFIIGFEGLNVEMAEGLMGLPARDETGDGTC